MQLVVASKDAVMFVVGAATVAAALPKDSGKQEERGNKSVKGLASSVCEVATAVLTQPSVALGIVEMTRRETNSTLQVQMTGREEAKARIEEAKARLAAGESHYREASRKVKNQFGQCPAEQPLRDCLDHSPFTDLQHFREHPTLLDTTAKVFANTYITPSRVKKGVSEAINTSTKLGVWLDKPVVLTQVLLEASVEACCVRTSSK